jgi:uncharacterized membrane protein YgdD (TMEM256/DUF423 family)
MMKSNQLTPFLKKYFMHRKYLTTGSLLAGLAVILGAFGAHKLKEMVPPETVASFQTGVQYQMYHSLALILVAIVFERFSNKYITWSGACFITGIILFSGSLYLLTALKASDQVGLKGLGLITPIGGVFFVLGWVFLVLGVRSRSRE